MLPELLQKANFFNLLLRIDIDLADQVQGKGCPHCGGPLHQAFYPRKPRGGPVDIPEECAVRRSLCCGNEECRKRTLPPSCLFMGRRVYWGAVVLVVMTLRQGRDCGTSLALLERRFGICRQTLKRWISYYRDAFPQSPVWRSIRGFVVATVSDNALPGALLRYFMDSSASVETAVSACLRFLATGTLIPNGL